ncbi:MAG TPA: aminotransferase class III-fold pyridoxal phosphate-dependent enzyme, partial [Candidatus Korarchaeota archaeon]|nr:aminotransferase class III-fold pyridoxal phosphate-dependent enzyme [Candidatus Korarchaeota archaeon]
DDYLSKVVKKLRDHEILYIADEIQTGFCRTGKMFAVEWYGVEPDIMTVGKGIASGLPIAATLISDEISEVLSPIDHCSTYGGNALVCAAGLENIKILMEERYDERALKLGSLFLERLKEIAERQEMIGDVRGKGLMIGVELVKDKEKKVPAPDLAEAVRLEAQKRGVLLNTGGVHGCVLRIQPPIAITEEQAERALNVIEDSMRAVR